MVFYKNCIPKPPLIKGRDHPGDGRFNCNGKAVLSGLTRELTVNAEKKGDNFELTTQTKLSPEARPIEFVFSIEYVTYYSILSLNTRIKNSTQWL